MTTRSLQKSVEEFALYYRTFVVIVGFLGNASCIRMLLVNRGLRNSSVTQYLVALAIADLMYSTTSGLNLVEKWTGWDALPRFRLCNIVLVS